MLFLRSEAIQLTLVVILSFLLFYSIVLSEYSSLLKGIAAVALLLITGILLRQLSGAEGWSGFVMVKTKEGIHIVDWFHRLVQEKWNTLTDLGLVMGFGLSTILGFKYLSKKFYLLAMLVFVVYVLILTPYIPAIMFGLIDLPRNSGDVQQAGALLLPTAIALFLFGFVGMVIFSLLANTYSILAAMVSFLSGNAAALAATSPGATLIIPGLNLPLFEGIIALLILLIVHEGGHGVSARLSKIKIKSTGFLTFGFIPVGAFVDIDEKQLTYKKERDQIRVAVAGSTGNLITAFLFLIPVILLLGILPNYYANEVVISGFTRVIETDGGELTVGTRINSINGVELTSLSDFAEARKTIKPDSDVLLETSAGAMTIKTNEKAKMGLSVSQPLLPEYGWLKNLYNILGLTAVLNFLIGVINLLPLPAFDGYRLFDIGLRNRALLRALSYVIIAAFIINLLPWFWR